MGQDIFLANREPCLTRAWMLGVCVLLCLSSGANALMCTVCNSEGPGETCVPAPPYVEECVDNPSTGHPPSCIMYRITSMVNNKVLRYYKRCGFYTTECQTREVLRDIQQMHELLCCNNKNQCL